MTKQEFFERLRGLAGTSQSYRSGIDMFLTQASHRDAVLYELLQVKMLEVEILISRLTK
jgi:hypothetical protein